ncbi:hypothetical protein [Flavobacterium rhizosphaerae]|uniref:DUF308 domain-containing protein n=1 Tax=Flavobacterium rhizosphaerae TaxID=3163298 RepID=A0ABW8Z0U0_9FLAO
MKKAELILASVALVAMILSLFDIPVNIVVVTFLALLSLVYFFTGFLLFRPKGTWQVVGSIVAGITFSILVIGILFKFMFWPGGSAMLFPGIVLALLVAIICVVKYFATKQAFYKNIVLRCGIYVIITMFFLFMQDSWILQFKYREYPEYIEALKKAEANPDDEQGWRDAQAIKDSLFYEEYKREQSAL